ncbi:hypothetical protein ASD99_27070 [Mesorhizobium sp. Root695]|nr:hypothetical protein ASD99_27070 [Mesorhizobium sp. Root695]
MELTSWPNQLHGRPPPSAAGQTKSGIDMECDLVDDPIVDHRFHPTEHRRNSEALEPPAAQLLRSEET